MSFFTELKRRNVFRVGFAYAIAAWVLLQVVDLVLENIAAPDWVMKVFMLGVAVGFPVAVIIAWAYEMTPEGIKRESEVDRTQSVVHTTGRKLDRIIIGFLAVAVVFLLIDPFENRDTAEPVVVDVVTGPSVHPELRPNRASVSRELLAKEVARQMIAKPNDHKLAVCSHGSSGTQLVGHGGGVGFKLRPNRGAIVRVQLPINIVAIVKWTSTPPHNDKSAIAGHSY